ncbi:Hypothetical Zinc-finger containing protein [Cronobacter turicensis 564]|nr:Hypothetical Zinc-finger containing protein [Cronobacter turicensis 564]
MFNHRGGLMASGWANDGAVQDQIDSTVEDAAPQGDPGRAFVR